MVCHCPEDGPLEVVPNSRDAEPPTRIGRRTAPAAPRLGYWAGESPR